MAAAFGAQNTFLGKALGGNSIGGLGELTAAVFAPGNDTDPVSLGAGISAGGAGLGVLPLGGPGIKGAAGIAQDAFVKSFTQGFNNGLAANITELSAQAPEDTASYVGVAKLVVDTAFYAYGYAQCKQ